MENVKTNVKIMSYIIFIRFLGANMPVWIKKIPAKKKKTPANFLKVPAKKIKVVTKKIKVPAKKNKVFSNFFETPAKKIKIPAFYDFWLVKKGGVPANLK